MEVMKERDAQEIISGVWWVGVKDLNKKVFDALIPLPQGTSYNSYLVKGKDKVALIDTVAPGFEEELVEKISQLTKISELSYIVMNHAEPDHGGAIPKLMGLNKKALLVASQKGAELAQAFYHVPKERIMIVKEGDAIKLGNKTLRFIDAPWLHWPETMFTYLEEDKILFPCDFFGSHTALGFYDEGSEESINLAKKYFGEIMLPFREMGKKALEKIGKLDIKIVAPSHGPIYKNPKAIMNAYKEWASGKTKNKAVIVYASMWGSTESMIKIIADALQKEGVEVRLYNLVNVDVGELAKDLVDSSALVLGAPTVLGAMHPLGIFAAHLIKSLRPPLKYGVILGSYGWSGSVVRQAEEILTPLKIEFVGELEINGPPSIEDKKKIIELGKELAKKIRL